MTLVTYALQAALRGFYVFPAKPGTKLPLVKWGTDEPATRDVAKIIEWWTKWPMANIGIATKPSGLVVIDTDFPKQGQAVPKEYQDQDIHNGEDQLSFLAEKLGDGNFNWLNTYTVKTPSGGIHRYYLAPDHLDIRNSQPLYGCYALDVRAGGADIAGGIAFAVGSRNADGVAYEAMLDLPIVPMPEWLAQRCMERPPNVVTPAQQTRPLDPFSTQADTIARISGWLLRQPQGSHSAGVYWAACELRDADVDQGNAVDAILTAAQRWPDSKHGWGTSRVVTAVNSAYSRPKRPKRY